MGRNIIVNERMGRFLTQFFKKCLKLSSQANSELPFIRLSCNLSIYCNWDLQGPFSHLGTLGWCCVCHQLQPLSGSMGDWYGGYLPDAWWRCHECQMLLASHWVCPQHAWSLPLTVPIETFLFQGSVPPAPAQCFPSMSDKSSWLLSELQEAKGQNAGPHSSIYDPGSLGNFLPLAWLLYSCL